MTATNASEGAESTLSEIPTTPLGKTKLMPILAEASRLADSNSSSTARYFTIDTGGDPRHGSCYVCFHAVHSNLSGKAGLGIVFQGYGGFTSGDRWRKATEADLNTNIEMPFHMVDKGHYNEVSLQWLECLLNPEGPFKDLLPLMAWNTPVAVQENKCFLFPDVSFIPARLTWCFAIASRLGFANPRVVWRYLHMLERGCSKNMALLIAGGFEREVVAGKLTGKIIKSYTAGFLGVDVTAFAGRMLYACPVKDKPFKDSDVGTYGSAKVFQSGKIDLQNLRFNDWDEVIKYTQQRADEQFVELNSKAA